MIRIITVLFLLLTISAAWSQKKLDQFNNNFEGLSDNNISAILQDKFGFMWFATNNGLCRFDGYTYKYYVNNPGDTNSISLNRITDIVQDSTGNLWVGTFGGGLNYFNRKLEKFTRYTNKSNDSKSLSNNGVLKLFIDSEKNLWIGTEDGLNLLNPNKGTFERYSSANSSLSNNYISAIAEDNEGNIWIGTLGGGVCVFDKNSRKFSTYKNLTTDLQSISDNNIRCITRDNIGNIWIGTLQNGLNLAERNKTGGYSFKHFINETDNPNSLANNSILSIYEDSKYNLWIGTENGGVDLYDRNKDVFIHHKYNSEDENSLAGNSVWSILEDKAGGLWFGTFNKGVSRWDPNRDKFLHYTLNLQKSKDFQNITVTSFFELEQDKILIGTDGSGFFLWEPDKQRFTQINRNNSPASIESNVVLTMASDSRNRIWMGTWGGGINISRGNITDNNFEKVFTYENIFSISRDKDNTMWVGTWGAGLHVIQDGWDKVYQYSPSDSDKLSISSGNIFCTMQDSYNRTWIGTLNGLNLVSGSFDSSFTFQKFYHQTNDTTSLWSNTVLCLFEDSRRNLWVGTSFGLNKYEVKTGKFVRIVNECIANKEIKAILEDANGTLWISADNNLIRYNPRDNKALCYDKGDGVHTRGFSVGAALKTSDNSFLYGGKNGYIQFNPESQQENDFVPPVHIIDFKVFNKSVVPEKNGTLEENVMFTHEITLTSKQNVFSIEFVALNYTHPEKNQYAYMLEGLEKDWNYVGNLRFASYSNLNPGEYTFLVKASNNDNQWNDTPVKLKIIVRPPFFKSWWFKSILLLVLVYLIYSIYMSRVKQIRRKFDFQEKQFQSNKIESEKEIIKLQKDRLDTELEYTNKELASITMNILQKNEKMITIRDQLLELIPGADKDVQRKLKLITKEIEDDLESENKWDRFESKFDIIHDNFLKRFTEKYPKITHKDLKMCAFIRMNISNKEIANLLNITLRSVESSRYRIRKKMELDSEVNLNDFIIRF